MPVAGKEDVELLAVTGPTSVELVVEAEEEEPVVSGGGKVYGGGGPYVGGPVMKDVGAEEVLLLAVTGEPLVPDGDDVGLVSMIPVPDDLVG